MQTICRTYLIVWLHQDLIILTQRHKKHNGSDILKAVNPLPPLWPLAPYIYHPDGRMKAKEDKKWKKERGKNKLACKFGWPSFW